MPRYKYTGIKSNGKKVKGVLIANNDRDLFARLRDLDIYMESFSLDDDDSSYKLINSKELSNFCRSLGTLLGSGVSLVRALNIVSKEEGTDQKYREIYADLLKQVRTGILISDAMENTGKAFPSMLVHMIRSAEESGNMDKVCIQMADYYEKEFKLESKVKGAFAYPILLVCMLVGVIILLFTFVIPRFEELFSTLETIPLPTRILIGISDLFTQHYIGIGVFVLFMVIGIKFAMMLPTVKYYWDMMLTRLPMFGNLNKTIYTARFARTLSSLYIAGLPMSNAIGIAKNVIGNTYVESQLDKVIMSIRAGNNLSEAISTVDGFTQKLTSSIQIGEETGALDTMLVSISDMLDYESEQAITAMVGVLEPVMIIIMGAVVLFVIISVMLPMYESYSAIDMATYE